MISQGFNLEGTNLPIGGYRASGADLLISELPKESETDYIELGNIVLEVSTNTGNIVL